LIITLTIPDSIANETQPLLSAGVYRNTILEIQTLEEEIEVTMNNASDEDNKSMNNVIDPRIQQQDKDDVGEDEGASSSSSSQWYYFGSQLREYRHNPCLMRPVSLVMFLIFGLFLFVTLLLQVPALILGLILAPILQRSSWYVEFLYPLPIGRWAHFFLMGLSSKMKNKSADKNRGFHSRTIEQRYEVVPGRIYVHALPQWIDNLGYLIVCLPEPTIERTERSIITVDEGRDPIVGLVIDCGDSDSVVRAVEMIQEFHYNKRPIRLQSILSTHKHHDHTGGNLGLINHPIMGTNIKNVYGGAVEKVPCCTDPLRNGDKVRLPKFQSNDMNELIEIEVIAVPAHTRGSLVYRLRTLSAAKQVEYLFTGDTIFSGGAGVSFEADVGVETDGQLAKSNGNTFIRGTLGASAMERCFSEVLVRAMPDDLSKDVGDRILIFPGHEYTQELLARQFQNVGGEASKWKNFEPRDFFETASYMYTSFHRRSLPHNSGRLLMIPSTLQRELHVNTHYRSLRRSAELVVRAIVFWYNNFCKHKIPASKLLNGINHIPSSRQRKEPRKSASSIKQWNVNADDVSKSVFTTVYTADLEAIIQDISSGRLDQEDALERLQGMSRRLEIPVVNKRGIPGFLPSDKNIYRGICALTLIGSQPTAMSISDSRKMNIPPPNDYNSDKILVSKKRLILILTRFDMIHTHEGEDVAAMIDQLWNEANEYCNPKEYQQDNHEGHTGNDVESRHWHDKIEIGMLKWILYGVSANQPSWFSKIFCMPCSSNLPGNRHVFPEHPARKMNQKSGDLVSHDILTCYLCRDATGNWKSTSDSGGMSSSLTSSSNIIEIESPHRRYSRRETESDESVDEDTRSGEIEIARSILKEHSTKTVMPTS
jgi:glyoxylase-like metal-dependent hydrolase (beta-lactamase superfamily II)